MFEFPSFPPPGEMVDIGTHKLHMLSQGKGTPVVVIDAASGDNVLAWRQIQPEIAKFTQVIAYDRSGLGWSERGTSPANRETVVKELHTLLTSIDTLGPYVLVGHSLGGIHVRLFAQRYPDLVAGLVLVDASHEDNYSESCQHVSGYTKHFGDYVKMFEDLSQKSHQEVIEQLVDTSASDIEKLPKDQQMVLDRMRPAQMAVVAEEMRSFAGETSQARGLDSFGDLPLIVLTALKPIEWVLNREESLKWSEINRELQTQIASLSSHGKQIFVEDAGHYIQNDKPQVVIDAIREVVEMVRQETAD